MLLGAVLVPAVASGQTPPGSAADEVITTAPPLLLSPGQIQTIAVSNVKRIAIGDPAIADVTLMSSTQLLVQAKKTGSTNLIIWDAEGQRELPIAVIDSTPDAVTNELPQLLADLQLGAVRVERKGSKVFLIGEVASEQQKTLLEELVALYPDVIVNLVSVGPAPPAPVSAPSPLVQLTVQVLELNRQDIEKLGVSWTQSVALTESALSASSVSDQLLRIGEAATRGSLVATLNALVQQNRARVLSEPKLVTASGKEASSFIGVEVPTIQATSFGTGTASVGASITFRQTGVLLKITPQVTGEDEQRITTNIQAEVSGVDTSVGLSVPVGSQTILVPGFKVRKASTEVTTASGETIVIAGLLEAEDTADMTQVPALGSIPVLGRLFRNPEKKTTRRELVIAVTPELMAEAGKTAERGLAVEQALAVAEVTASVDDPRLRYALQVQERIAKALRYPSREKESGVEGTVKLRLHLFADGTLGQAMVAKSSGIEALDLEALKVAETAAPYPLFPNQLAERELWLEVPIIFRP